MIEFSEFKYPISINDLSKPGGVRIHIVGPLKVIDLQGKEISIAGRKSRALLGCLCLSPGDHITRGRLAGLLWDRSPEQQAKASLRQALYELTAALDSTAPDLLHVDREIVRLQPEHCWIDAASMVDAASSERGDFRDLLAPPTERLLEDFDGLTAAFDQFLQTERSRLQNRLIKSLESHLQRTIAASGTAAERAAIARKLITVEPTHEVATRALMKSFVELGDRAQAIREFERLKRTLQVLLDIEPSKETYTFYEAVRALRTRTPSGLLRQPDSAISTNGGEHTQLSSPTLSSDETLGARSQVSIAVLPFHATEQTHTSIQIIEGITDEIIACLSRINGFFVISRLSTLSFSDRRRSPQEIGAALGARYIVSGSVGFVAEKGRFAIELTDSDTGHVLFSQKFDESIKDIFELQDRVSFKIVKQIAPYLRELELKRMRTKRPENLGAYDYLLRGIDKMHNTSPEIFQSAEENFAAAIKMDPQYAAAYAWLGYWHALRIGQGWSTDPKDDAAKSDKFVQAAVECDSTDSLSLALYGHLRAYLHKDFKVGFERLERALIINPNSAPAWLWTGAAHAWMGEAGPAIEKAERAMSLSPYDPLMYAYCGIAGMAYLMDRQFDRAIEFALRSMQENRTYTHAYRLLTIALNLAGRREQAGAAAQQLLQLEPSLTVERFRERYPGSAYPNCLMLCQALEQAGIPTR
jgi:DNA-binding SARP family transcriptional activator